MDDFLQNLVIVLLEGLHLSLELLIFIVQVKCFFECPVIVLIIHLGHLIIFKYLPSTVSENYLIS